MIGRGLGTHPRSGSLRHRLVIEAPVRTPDGGGGASVAWTTLGEVWASIDPVSGTEGLVAEATSGRITHEVVVRFRPDIEPRMRFRFGSRLLAILAVLDVDERSRMLRCHCREELL